MQLYKYPRTQHIQGSKLQTGDHDLTQVPFESLKGQYLVVEEKLDGANCGISFDNHGKLFIQSRGHFLVGGAREKHFNVLKQWANVHSSWLFDCLTDKYVMYAEWMYCKHTVFYDMLPHYVMEFDIYDPSTDTFMSTAKRHELLSGLPIVSVPVVWSGKAESLEHLVSLVKPSLYKSPRWRDNLIVSAQQRNIDPEKVLTQTDMCDISEGLYCKVEDDDRVSWRYKYVRNTFLNSILDSETHWMDRPIIPNQLRNDVDIFAW